MASECDHLGCANRTQKTLVHLLEHLDTNSPWIATAAFYKALHIVEAVFANDGAIGHTSDHDERDKKLKTTRKYEQIYRNYSPLKRASMNARYLSDCSTFDKYLPPQRVVTELLKHHLHQIEKSASKFLSGQTKLMPIQSAFSTEGV